MPTISYVAAVAKSGNPGREFVESIQVVSADVLALPHIHPAIVHHELVIRSIQIVDVDEVVRPLAHL